MKKTGFPKTVIILLALAAVAVKICSQFYVPFLWFKDLGYKQLYLTPIVAKIEIGVISFLIYFLIIFSMGLIAYRVFVKAEKEQVRSKFHLFVIENLRTTEEKDITPADPKKVVSILLLISTVISFFFALGATENGWMKLLMYRHASPFGVSEQVFNKDISFYVFNIPLYNFILSSLAFSLTAIVIISVVFYVSTGLIKMRGNPLERGAFHVPRSIRRFWAILAGILFILFGMIKYLSMYAVMYSQSGYVYGAGYSDIHVTIPLAKVMTVLAILCGIACFLYFFINDHRLILGPVVIYSVVAIVGTLAFGLVQYNVSNNEFSKEKPYIEQEIKFTKLAYNLNNIQIKDYPGTAKISPQNIANNRSTVDNIRLNDPAPLQTVLSQNQGLRYYYRFNDIDIDRYMIDNQYRQVLLAAREISDEALTEKAGTFVNLTMRYTHGYGAAATLANEIDDSGYAKLIIKDIPPQSQVKGMEIKEPRIYFGELTNDTTYGYVIGNTAAKEFDYPQGDNNVENRYTGKTGLSLTGFNKLLLSSYFNTFRFYMTNEITPNSKLLMNRNIVDRVQTLMPYLKLDSDPYVVIADNGKLYWLIDAYTSTDHFPYAAPAGDLNYIRNSVKILIDPYNGNVDFYTFDKSDPILKALSKIFPGVFQDSSRMPAGLIKHIRYPEDYFNVQSNILQNFHVANPSVFYNREDTWDIAKRVVNQSTQNVDPYYSVMKLPGETDSEFVLMLPFTPASRQEQHRNNLVAWLAGRNDGAHYGELILYKVPKNVEIQGPLMIDSLIDQDTLISGKMSLWGQGGSEVIRGNLLAVPIDGGFIYVEPIYIKAVQQGASIPQMQAIVFAIDKKIIMVETKSLDKAMAAFFAQEGLAPETPATPGTPPPAEAGQPKVVNPKDSIMQKIQDIKRQLQDLESQVKSL